VYKLINCSSLLVPAAAFQQPFVGNLKTKKTLQKYNLINRPGNTEDDKSSGNSDDVPACMFAAICRRRALPGEKI
jgi:hypothetical protein